MIKPVAFIVEDDPDQTFVFTNALQEAGYEIETFSDGISALAKLETAVPSLVLLDLHLPKMSGENVLTGIRSDERLVNTKVILTTADYRLAKSLESKTNLILIKPISFIQLRTLADRLRVDLVS